MSDGECTTTGVVMSAGCGSCWASTVELRESSRVQATKATRIRGMWYLLRVAVDDSFGVCVCCEGCRGSLLQLEEVGGMAGGSEMICGCRRSDRSHTGTSCATGTDDAVCARYWSTYRMYICVEKYPN